MGANRLPNRFQGTSSAFSSVASGGGPRTFCAPSWPWLYIELMMVNSDSWWLMVIDDDLPLW